VGSNPTGVTRLPIGDVVQRPRMRPCQGRDRGFESRRPRHTSSERLVVMQAFSCSHKKCLHRFMASAPRAFLKIHIPIREPIAKHIGHVVTPGFEEWAGQRPRHDVDLLQSDLHDIVYHNRTNLPIMEKAQPCGCACLITSIQQDVTGLLARGSKDCKEREHEDTAAQHHDDEYWDQHNP
jgi:hypothetical protein